jgi:hypothetical protein
MELWRKKNGKERKGGILLKNPLEFGQIATRLRIEQGREQQKKQLGSSRQGEKE